MKRHVSLQYAIIADNSDEAQKIVVKYGLKPARSDKDLLRKLNYIISTYKEEALFDLARIHPDAALILAAHESDGKENKSNSCGCMSNAYGAKSAFGDLEEYLDIAGEKKKSRIIEKTDYTPLIALTAITGILILALTK